MEFPIKKKPSHGKSGEDDMRCHVFPTDGPVHHDPKHSIWRACPIHLSFFTMRLTSHVEAWLVHGWEFLLRGRMPKPLCPVALSFWLASVAGWWNQQVT